MTYWRWLAMLVFAAVLFVAFLYFVRGSGNSPRSLTELREERLRLEQVEPRRAPLWVPPPYGAPTTNA